MNITQEALKERIKELTCLYEVSSFIVNASKENLDEVLRAIAFSVKRGFHHPNKTQVAINVSGMKIITGKSIGNCSLSSHILVFNKKEGHIKVTVQDFELGFLVEEQALLDSIALKLGNLLEKLQIQENERSLRRQMERASRLAILGEITAGIAHELNTPLANILGYAELLKSDLQDCNMGIQDVDRIIQSSIFTREVVKKLMFFACEMPQEMNEVNIVPHVKGAMDLLDNSFKKEEVKYKLVMDKEKICLKADIIQLTQIIFNLMINALYFSPKKGLVLLEVLDGNSGITIRVSDEGPGLSEKALDKVFEPFFTTKPIGEGSGLGLSVVHGIVASHKGTIEADNGKKSGAIFTVKIPK
ncbi:HAMP domain-containing sensor histidine kinase [Cytophaga sp. FL35]|uniref:sensor histidine kinase n=1 Tax=Cytophaga sp. FL35 TaxID=1904456 RepID=UPI0016539486|nr:HAMP domain-containing sensor histidine kinase [Cytophaga sp. FL35]MBC6999282.1 HAMP domain-containing histidine kinase [Cytophaga sp. FL35]